MENDKLLKCYDPRQSESSTETRTLSLLDRAAFLCTLPPFTKIWRLSHNISLHEPMHQKISWNSPNEKRTVLRIKTNVISYNCSTPLVRYWIWIQIQVGLVGVLHSSIFCSWLSLTCRNCRIIPWTIWKNRLVPLLLGDTQIFFALVMLSLCYS